MPSPPAPPRGRADGLRPRTTGIPFGWLDAAWVGLLAGLAELIVVVARAQLLQGSLFRRNSHLVWMIPLADLIAALAATAVVLGVALAARPVRGALAAVVLTLGLWMPLLAVPGPSAPAGLVLSFGLAIWLAPVWQASAARMHGLVRRTLPALALAVGGLALLPPAATLLSAAEANRGRPAPPQGKPDVVLLVLDTVRSDEVGLDPSSPGPTPHLAALAARGTRFDLTVSPSPWTLPAHASLFTGRWPGELAVGPDRALDRRFPTLAEAFAASGYDTGGFVANTVFCSREYGLARGFAHYEDHVVDPVELLRSSALGWLVAERLTPWLDRFLVALNREPRHPLEGDAFRKDAERVHRDFLAWLDRPRDRPVFAFLNDLDAHDPYLLPARERARFRPRPYSLEDVRLLRDWITTTAVPRSDAELARAREAYRECIAALDAQVGRLVAELDRRNRLDNMILVVASDHGEHFGEHALDGVPVSGHRATLYQPEVRVPLMIVAPGRLPAGAAVVEEVSLRDLPATLAELAGMAGSPFPGRSLVAAAHGRDGSGGDANVRAEYASRLQDPPGLRYARPAPGVRRSLVEDGKSYHWIDGHREELYDLEHDPLEQRDLSRRPESSELLRRMRGKLGGAVSVSP